MNVRRQGRPKWKNGQFDCVCKAVVKTVAGRGQASNGTMRVRPRMQRACNERVMLLTLSQYVCNKAQYLVYVPTSSKCSEGTNVVAGSSALLKMECAAAWQ